MFAYRKKKRSTIFAISAKPCRKKIVINWRAYFLGAAQETVNRFFNEKIWKIFPQNNWLVFFGRDLSDQLLLAYPEAKNVSISKDIIKGIKIIITGRSPAAIWCDSLAIPVSESIDATSTQAVVALPQSEKCFFTDDEGLLYHEAPEIFGTGLPTFFDSYQQGLLPGNQAIASPTILFASQLKKQLREIGIDLPGFMTGASDSTDLFAFTDESWVVYFNMARPLQSQVKVLGALLNGEIKDKRVGLKYIDLRLAGKVYYK
ncbi:MAG: hypothetical protein UW11_C0037G0006 [Parcubacteria group bacterium GW2011_GWA2_43_9b]|nr:MAG: hypothetical protein UW11_C0037G0006 [Parcubacteria group bacterium GW2011_GWA2_43_9b]